MINTPQSVLPKQGKGGRGRAGDLIEILTQENSTKGNTGECVQVINQRVQERGKWITNKMVDG